MKLRWERAALISVLILAGVLRLGYVGVNPFASDEARVSLLALKMARQGEIAINGISSSTGARNLPASI
jgi:predicted membrane-bound mannosyltransferase